MFNSNSGRNGNGEERGDRLAESQETTANFGQLQLADSLFQRFSEKISPSLYYSVDSGILNNSEQNIIIFHANIRSLQKNFQSLLDLINTFTKYPDIICITETRLRGSPLMNVTLPNYELLYSNSPTNAGGVAMYISKNFAIQSVSKQDLLIQNCEDLWLHVSLRNTPMQFVIGVLYRHPHNSVREFLERLNNKIADLNSSKKIYYIIGDINIDISPNVRSSNKQNYLNMLESNGAVSIINKPTRITPTSCTTLDHIITNDRNHTILPGIIKTDISDHFPIFCEINIDHKIKIVKKPYIRDLSKFKLDSYCDELNISLHNYLLNLPSMQNSNLIFEQAFQEFVNVVKNVVDKHAPLKIASRKQNRLNKKPWITKGLVTSIRKMQKLFETHFLKGNDSQKRFYKLYANKLNKLKYHSKKMYLNREFEENKHNPRKTWKTINSLLHNKTKTADFPSEIKTDGITADDPTEIANCLNKYFCTIGEKLAQNVQTNNDLNYRTYLKNPVSSTIFLQPTQVSEVYTAIMSLNTNKSPGFDNIPAYFVRSAAKILAYPLSVLVNQSFELGYFPSCLKTAKVIPLHKTGEKCLPTNYRPISILTCFSKIFERLIFTRLTNFFDKHSVISPTQYGFRKHHSTSHAILDIVTKTYDNINNNKYTGLVFLDLKKAFDTVSHEILIGKLKHYGIRGQAHELLNSYLAGRKQYVTDSHISSITANISYGVPQGSTLGPLLFLIYINDIYNSTSSLPTLFADDTCLAINANSLSNLELNIHSELEKISKWVNANQLTINPEKTNILVIPPKLKSTHDKIVVNINSTPIKIVKEVKYLGIIVDNKLTFGPHIAHLESKLSRAI